MRLSLSRVPLCHLNGTTTAQTRQVRLAVALAHARAQFIGDALDALIPGASARARRTAYDPTSFLERASDSGVPGRRLRRGAW